MKRICQICGREEDIINKGKIVPHRKCPECKRYTCEPCLTTSIAVGYNKKICSYCGYVFWKKKVFFSPDKAAKAAKNVYKTAGTLYERYLKRPESESTLEFNLMDNNRSNVDLTEAISVTIGDLPMKIKDRKLGTCTIQVTPVLLRSWQTKVPAVKIEFLNHVITFGSDEELDRIFRNVVLG